MMNKIVEPLCLYINIYKNHSAAKKTRKSWHRLKVIHEANAL